MGGESLTLEVRSSNQPAIVMYETLGYDHAGIGAAVLPEWGGRGGDEEENVLGISNFEFRISNFRKRLGKRSAFTGGAWHPDMMLPSNRRRQRSELRFTGGAWHPAMMLSSTSCRRAWHPLGKRDGKRVSLKSGAPHRNVAELFRVSNHLLRPYELVETFGGQQTELNRGFLERETLLVGLLGDLGGVVVADFRVERGH